MRLASSLVAVSHLSFPNPISSRRPAGIALKGDHSTFIVTLFLYHSASVMLVSVSRPGGTCAETMLPARSGFFKATSFRISERDLSFP